MLSWLKYIVPRERKFFPLFEKVSGNLVQITKTLVELVNAPSAERRTELGKEVERLEHVGDNTSHEIFNELSTTFITPFDREDIHDLTCALDDVVDYCHGATKRIALYKIIQIHPGMIKLAELLAKGAEELNQAVLQLKDLKNVNRIKETCVRINSIENHADDIFDMSIAQLFEDEKDAIKLIKIKEILSSLETATDKCEDCANVLESIVLKNA
ncbi:MAG: DUF47 domain-containing protein [Bacteroidetes bacterium]|nr:DUF47 domain-containing protein [Bacteroidota bacterium]